MVEKEKEYNPKTDSDVRDIRLAFKAILFIVILILIGTVVQALFATGNLRISAPNDIEYTFANDKLYNSTIMGQQKWWDKNEDTFNIRQREQYTQTYNATYSFTNDIIGSQPIGWYEGSQHTGDSTYSISASVYGHDMVLNLTADVIGEEWSETYTILNNTGSNGYIEFWLLTKDISVGGGDIVNIGSEPEYSATTTLTGIFFLNEKLYASQSDGVGGVDYTPMGPAANNTWTHVKVWYELTTDVFSVWQDGTKYIDDVGFQYDNDFDTNEIDIFKIGSWRSSNRLAGFFLDGLGIYVGGLYYGTYSFTDDIIGGNPTDWTIYEDGGGQVDVVSGLDGHSKVVRILDASVSYFNGMSQDFTSSPKTSGTIEWYWNSPDTIKKSHYGSYGGIGQNNMFFLLMINSKFRYFDGGWQDLGVIALNDNWYHIRIDFECTVGNYKGLSQYDYTIYINGTNYGTFDFITDVNDLRWIEFITDTANSGYFSYIDAIGYSWDSNYNVGDNLIELTDYNVGDNYLPIIEISTTEYEVDEWQFRYNPDVRYQYVDGSDNPSGWNDLWDIPGIIDNVNTLNYGATSGEPDWGYQRWVVVHIDDNGGLYKVFSGENDYYYNITFNFGINQLDDTDVGANAIVLYLKDGTNYISSVYLRYNGNAELYYNGTSSIIGTFDTTNNYTINYFIDMNRQIQTFTMSYWNTHIELFNYTAPFYQTGNSIDRVQYYHINTGVDEVDSDLFSISMYNTNGSVSDDVGEIEWYGIGYPVLDPIFDRWYYTEYNLITLTGNFQNVSLFHELFGGLVFDDFLPWTTFGYEFTNIYMVLGNQYPTQATITLWMKGNFTFNSISIDGVKLNDEVGNSFPLILDNSAGMDISESYFYVSNDILYYTMTTDDTDLEYISATFDINNQNTFNYTIFWGGIKTYENLVVEFRVNYDDSTYNPFPFKTVLQYQNAILPQGMIISNFQLIITDNDNDANGVITGYLYSITLIFTTGVLFDIIISDYLSILTPILLITIITITIWQTTKKRVGNMLIVPSITFMSFSVFIMDLIPLWLLFVMLISSGVLIYSKWKEQFLMFISFATMITGFLSFASIIDFWLFYMTFVLMVGYLIFGVRKTIQG